MSTTPFVKFKQDLGDNKFALNTVGYGMTEAGIWLPIKVTDEGVQEVRQSGTIMALDPDTGEPQPVSLMKDPEGNFVLRTVDSAPWGWDTDNEAKRTISKARSYEILVDEEWKTQTEYFYGIKVPDTARGAIIELVNYEIRHAIETPTEFSMTAYLITNAGYFGSTRNHIARKATNWDVTENRSKMIVITTDEIDTETLTYGGVDLVHFKMPLTRFINIALGVEGVFDTEQPDAGFLTHLAITWLH